MLTVAYLANHFPSAVEPYVGEEIKELRSRGVRVIAGSVREPAAPDQGSLTPDSVPEIVVMRQLRIVALVQAAWLCLRRWNRIADLSGRVVFRGGESPLQRLKALLHTWMGACYALQLRDQGVAHIHVHHGYFGSWIALVAARLLDAGFSMTLHGSDLLLHGTYLDAKLAGCDFCLTVSHYNRRYILQRHPTVDPRKILVARLGADVFERRSVTARDFGALARGAGHFNILAVGRLHAVKDHAFLLRACAQLRTRGVDFECSIAGEGPERRNLAALIRKYGLEERVILLGHVPREQMDSLYDRASVVVLTSRSEGVPLVLMEAMARGKVVLAPAITGIPELVIPGKTGFLYEPGSLGDFVARLLLIHSLTGERGSTHPSRILSASKQLDWVRFGARVLVQHNFNRKKNLEAFGDLFLQRAATQTRSPRHADLVLQQI